MAVFCCHGGPVAVVVQRPFPSPLSCRIQCGSVPAAPPMVFCCCGGPGAVVAKRPFPSPLSCRIQCGSVPAAPPVVFCCSVAIQQ